MNLSKLTIIILAWLPSLAALGAESSASEVALTSIATFASPAIGTKPAVDGVNGKVEFSGGASQFYSSATTISQPFQVGSSSQSSWSGAGRGLGTITVPLGHSFGFQMDMGAGAVRGYAKGTANGHLFWRDPDEGMVGVFGQGNYWAYGSGSTSWKAAAELERYFNRVTIKALIGAMGYGYNYTANYSVENYWNNLWGKNSTPDRFYDRVALAYYVTDDLMIAGGHTYVNGRNAGVARVEYIPEQFRGGAIAPSLFVRAVIGADNNSSIMSGLRIYFGNHDKSLIRRHREDDPEDEEYNIVGSAGFDYHSTDTPVDTGK